MGNNCVKTEDEVKEIQQRQPISMPHEAVVTFEKNSWQCNQEACSSSSKMFFYVKQPANCKFVLHVKLKKKRTYREPKSSKAELIVQVADKRLAFTETLTTEEHTIINLGHIEFKTAGYHHVQVSIVSEYECEFGELLVAGDTPIFFIRDSFHFGRRGPSIHLRFSPPAGAVIQAFYNEVTVPVGFDVEGSYYMACGFSHGYFGMQVNSSTERKVLFSCWHSPESEKDGHKCADKETCRVTCVNAAEDVTVKSFDHEGSGGQSFRSWDWKAGSTYKFLLIGKQVALNPPTAEYSAYFSPAEYDTDGRLKPERWLYHATFSRPHTTDSLSGIHSFLENFREVTGDQCRRVNYANQWMMDDKGTWMEINTAQLSVDNTAKREYRFDYEGGVEGDSFYLTNCGFFNKCAGCVSGNVTKSSKAELIVQVADKRLAFTETLTTEEHTIINLGHIEFKTAGYHHVQIHLRFSPPAGAVIQAFYNEVTVPVGFDVEGSYYMACGFSHGYFGMQVNSSTERKVLFSCWHSPESEKDGHKCADKETCRVTCVNAAEDVTVKSFDHEGSGGQSFRSWDWKAGSTYKFLLIGKQVALNPPTAEYSAYFSPAEYDTEGRLKPERWLYHATFSRPHTTDSLSGIHSFLENFREVTGDQCRRVNYANQWMMDDKGTWMEINTAQLSVDNTAKREYRFDYEGGVEGDSFYLTNCGFFNKCAGCKYTREKTARKPSMAV